ncbi:MAG: Hpt domain-containing protein [Oscillospiraceae bacterium]|nr:Hpt domain-containing protein [Oscillospiraceae bacterium]
MLDTEALNRIGIDAEEGIAYCADDSEFYEDMLREYLKESDARTADLRKHYAERNWPLYGICAHSVKSTSRMIGAKAVSETARKMELACRDGNDAAVLAGHEQFLKEYTDLTDCLRAVIRADG